MDAFSIMTSRLESVVSRIKTIYSYIFKFFLPAVTEDDGNGMFGKSTKGIRL